MLGYEILAQALAKQGVSNAYGIVGTLPLTQASLSSNLVSPFRRLASDTMGSGMSKLQPIPQATQVFSLACQEPVFVYLAQVTPMPSVGSSMPGQTHGP